MDRVVSSMDVIKFKLLLSRISADLISLIRHDIEPGTQNFRLRAVVDIAIACTSSFYPSKESNKIQRS